MKGAENDSTHTAFRSGRRAAESHRTCRGNQHLPLPDPVCPTGDHGYSLTVRDESEIMIDLARFAPFVKFTVETMLSVDECMASLKKMQELAK